MTSRASSANSRFVGMAEEEVSVAAAAADALGGTSALNLTPEV